MKESQYAGKRGNARWAVAVAMFFSLLIAFVNRLNLPLAMPQIAEHFDWTAEEVGAQGGLLLGSFYFAYGVSNIALTPIAVRFGVRKSLLGVVFLFSLFTALGAPLSFSLGLFVGTRVLLGLGEGVHFPMMSAATKVWYPLHERSRANVIWLSGGLLATILTPVVLVPVIDHFGWTVMLYGSGVLGLLIAAPMIYWYVYDNPRSSPHITKAEIEYIEAGLEQDEDPIPNWSFLRRTPFWLMMVTGALANYCVYGVLNWLPMYFVKAKDVDYGSLWYVAPIPYVVGLLAFALYAYMGDLFNKRIIMASAGFAGMAISVYLGTVAPNLLSTLVAFSFGTFFLCAFTSQEFAIVQRILPTAMIGKGSGLYNGLAVLVGSVGGTLALGQIIAWTNSYDAGMLSIVVAAGLGMITTFALSRKVAY